MQFQEDKLVETAAQIHGRILARFPESGLGAVAGGIVAASRESLERAKDIRRPNWWLRACLVAVGCLAVWGVVFYCQTRGDGVPFWQALIPFFDTTKSGFAFLTAVAIFLVTLEMRLKRRRAMKAIRELRSLAHIIDMHQLAKDPDQFEGGGEIIVSGLKMSPEMMGRYLHFCTELLAVVSKVGQFYVEDFHDNAVQSAVDRFEQLTTGLSNKIWQKLMILDRIKSHEVSANL